MTDNDTTLVDLFTSQEQPAVLKNQDLDFITVTAEYAYLFGFESIDHACGKSDYDIPCDAQEQASRFRELDQICININAPVTSIEVTEYSDGFQAYLTHRSILRNDQDKFVGVACYGVNLQDEDIALRKKTIFDFAKKHFLEPNIAGSFIIGDHNYNPIKDLQLETVETEILYFLVRGNTLKGISLILGLPNISLECAIASLIKKFNCDNQQQLIEKATTTSLLNYIPASLLK